MCPHSHKIYSFLILGDTTPLAVQLALRSSLIPHMQWVRESHSQFYKIEKISFSTERMAHTQFDTCRRAKMLKDFGDITQPAEFLIFLLPRVRQGRDSLIDRSATSNVEHHGTWSKLTWRWFLRTHKPYTKSHTRCHTRTDRIRDVYACYAKPP